MSLIAKMILIKLKVNSCPSSQDQNSLPKIKMDFTRGILILKTEKVNQKIMEIRSKT